MTRLQKHKTHKTHKTHVPWLFLAPFLLAVSAVCPVSLETAAQREHQKMDQKEFVLWTYAKEGREYPNE